jgi:fucose permease
MRDGAAHMAKEVKVEQPLLGERPIVKAFRWRPRLALALLLAYFGLFGTIIGAQGVLWAEIIQALSLSKTIFGGVQLVAPLLSVGLLLVSGQIDSWLGKKRMALAGLALLAAAQLALARAPNLALLLMALLVTGAGNALLETAMNSATLDWEQITRHNVMNAMHAGFSAGAMLGAFGAGALLGLGWRYDQVLLLLMLLAIVILIATLPVTYPPVVASDHAEHAGPAATLRMLVVRPGILVLAVLCLFGIVGESVANLWSVIYLRELGAHAVLGGAAFALFNGAMLTGRLFKTALVARKGARASLLVSGAGVTLSTVLLMLPGGVPIAVLAFGLLGLAVAGVVPTALSAAARLSPGNSGAVTGAIMATAYSGFIVIPPLTGWLADLFSLQVALVSVGLSGLGMLWLARRVR